jgi:hypothetical protein
MFDTIHHAEARKTLRTRGVAAEVRFDGLTYDMLDWSMAGVSFKTPANPPQAGEEVKLTLRFRLADETVGIWVDGRVIRSDDETTAVEFDDLTSYASRKFARVIDGLQARAPEAVH